MNFVSVGNQFGHMRTVPVREDIKTFADLEACLAALTYKQADEAQPQPDTVQVGSRMLCRPADRALIEAHVCQDAYHNICQLLNRPEGTIHWRIRPEFYCGHFSLVTEYRADGPERCQATDRQCVMDHDWLLLKVYARMRFEAE